MKTKRLFIGIPLESGEVSELETLQLSWKEALGLPRESLISKSDFHLTLHFLGAIEEGRVGLWLESLESHAKLKTFSFDLNRFLAFPNISKARVITVAGAVGNSPLTHLFYQMAETVQRLGSKLEERLYVPHVTLFRGKNLKIERALEVLKPIPIRISRFALYESPTHPRESRYQILKSYELKAALGTET
ncbi:MAG: RNA 2',3'-cyclic phosphodiesterase [Pseudomonadota bacterium]